MSRDASSTWSWLLKWHVVLGVSLGSMRHMGGYTANDDHVPFAPPSAMCCPFTRTGMEKHLYPKKNRMIVGLTRVAKSGRTTCMYYR